MDAAPNDSIATQSKKRSALSHIPKNANDAELNHEFSVNARRKLSVLSFSQDALECSGSPKGARNFSISTSGSLSNSSSNSPKNIRTTEVDEKTEKATFHKYG